MRRSNRFTGSVFALGIVSALAFVSVGQAADKKQAAPDQPSQVHRASDLTMKRGVQRSGKYEHHEIVEFTFHKIEAAQFNPKELSVDKSVPWKQGESTATQVRKAVDRVLKRGAQRPSGDVAVETITLVHEGFEIK
jgi:hypothetical protein